MTELRHERQILHAPDGHEIHMHMWSPESSVSHVIQVLHGLGEHAARYERFAHAAASRDYAVCVHDHRGHGPHTEELGHFADNNGWHLLVADALLVQDFSRERFADAPLMLLGHSMGSYIAQSFAMIYGDRLSALILSASTWPSRLQLLPALAIAHIEAWRLGIRGKSALLNKLGFGDFNKRFAPARTEMDWLSRDAAEVDKYIADPLCGGPYSCRLWLDILGGLIDISSDNALARVPVGLPLLITGGECDPVGGDRGMTRLMMHYAQSGHQRISVKVFPDGRHEMLNDSNRAEVTANWLDWIAANTRSAP
jgi:alpha-beta hydrolase superfamily lysophospholipase